MKLEDVGQIVATRSIKVNGGMETYTVKIGLPQRFPDSVDFYCPIQIDSNGHKGTVMFAAGIDSAQALQLALKLIGGTLHRLNLEHDGALRWEGDENGDLGFPLPE